jgi:hypothetical protein
MDYDVIEEMKEPASIEQPLQGEPLDNPPYEILIPIRHFTSRNLIVKDDEQFDLDLTRLNCNEKD